MNFRLARKRLEARYARRRVLGELGHERFRQIERLLDAYAVVAADDAVVTIGHRLRSSPSTRRRAKRSGVQPPSSPSTRRKAVFLIFPDGTRLVA
jgi:hypothetical protein